MLRLLAARSAPGVGATASAGAAAIRASSRILVARDTGLGRSSKISLLSIGSPLSSKCLERCSLSASRFFPSLDLSLLHWSAVRACRLLSARYAAASSGRYPFSLCLCLPVRAHTVLKYMACTRMRRDTRCRPKSMRWARSPKAVFRRCSMAVLALSLLSWYRSPSTGKILPSSSISMMKMWTKLLGSFMHILPGWGSV